ncbi:MAG: DUF3344 domain-containing protein [Methanobrevibacter sp.]|jgi:hypothetical protein|nr:DUF3344 domain-containing protein [Candidatus Methanovirga meridionalis]
MIIDMNNKYKILLLFVILSITVTAVIADADDEITISVDPEYASGDGAVYEGTENQFNTTIVVPEGGDPYDGVVARLYANDSEAEVANLTVNLTSGNNYFNITDPTVRNITNNSYGENNITYTLSLTVGEDIISSNRSIPLVYNGYLGKEFSPFHDDNIIKEYNITGGIIVDNKKNDTYLSNTTNSRTDNLTLTINKDNIVKTFAYVPYSWGPEDYSINLSVNDNSVDQPVCIDDKSNLGSSGNRVYGVLIFDITDLVSKGDNTINISKENGSAALYPTVFVTLYNESNGTNKKVIINDEADLLGTTGNGLNRSLEAKYNFPNINAKNIKNADLYSIFASNDNDDKFDLFLNDNEVEPEHTNGSQYSTDYVKVNVTKYIINNDNKVKYQLIKVDPSESETAVALSKILVLENEVPPAPSDSHFKGFFNSLSDLIAAVPTGVDGDFAFVRVNNQNHLFTWTNNSWFDNGVISLGFDGNPVFGDLGLGDLGSGDLGLGDLGSGGSYPGVGLSKTGFPLAVLLVILSISGFIIRRRK